MKIDTENSVFPTFSSILCSFGNNDIQPQMTNPDISFPFVHLPTPAYTEWNVPVTNPFMDSQACKTVNFGSFEPHSSINIPSIPYCAAIKHFSIDENFISHERASSVSISQTQSVSIHEVATMEQNVNKRPLKIGDAFHNSAGKRKKTMCSEEQCHHPRPQSDKPSMTNDGKTAPLRRSQKLGDRITALQKLVCPYGKTDTASVLHEAYVHIKLLQEQVQMLSAPYFRASLYFPQGLGAQKEDLRSRGLCLVPFIVDRESEYRKND